MRITLRNLRKKKGWRIETAARLFNMKVEALENYEEYRDVPSAEELRTMLKMMGFYFDEIVYIIYEDISRKYRR